MLISYGQFLFRYRNLVFPLVLFTLFIVFKPGFPSGNTKLDILLNIAGVLIIICGQMIRAAVIGLAYIKRGGKKKTIAADTLVTQGIFKHCRNPLYLGNLLIIAGFLLIYNSLPAYILGGAFFLISYMSIVTAEESFLRNKFNVEYEKYCKQVNRWIPNLSGITDTLKSMEFNWQRVLFKDYTTFLTWFTTVALLLSLEQVTYYGLADSIEFITWSFTLTLAVMIMTIWVRIYKKHGRLAR